MRHVEFEQAVADRLVQYGYVKAPLLERARDFQQARSMTLLRAIVELKLVSTDKLNGIIEEVSGKSAVDPSLLTVYPEYIETVSKLIPEEFVTQTLMFPVQSELDTIRVCMLNPTDKVFVGALEALSGCHVDTVAGHEHLLAAAISKHYMNGAVLDGLPSAAVSSEAVRSLTDAIVKQRIELPIETYSDPAVALVNRNHDRLASDPATLERVIRDPDVIAFVHQVLVRLVYAGASDIHFEPLESELRVRSRVDGAMRIAWRLPSALALVTVARLKVMAGLDIKPSREPLDARISHDLIWGKDVDFRFSSLPSLYGEKIVLRALDRSRKLQTLAEVGFDGETLERVRHASESPNGLILVTGPTGSGKTSTLYALVEDLNCEDVNIVSAEDPVESKIKGVTQVHCGEEAGISFVDALRSFLRQDPDVILVGEIRDQETAEISLKAALTGHLVMSTLHTNDAPGTILRLLNMDLDPYMVGSAVSLVLAQRLVRRLCEECKASSNTGITKVFGARERAVLRGATLYEPKGCADCSETGYRGRLAIFEALLVTDEIEELVAKKPSVVEIRELALKQGMITLRESGLRRVATGETSIEEVLTSTMGDASK